MKPSSFTQKLLQEFTSKGGFKTLATLKLSSSEYSVLLYLFNEAFTGHENVAHHHDELARLLGLSTGEISQGVEHLTKLRLISIVGEASSPLLQLELPGEAWKLSSIPQGKYTLVKRSTKKPRTPQKILAFKNLEDPLDEDSANEGADAQDHESAVVGRISTPTWQRLLNAFCQYQEPAEGKEAGERHASQELVAQHPVDQTLLIIHHFGRRLASLLLLAHHWDEYLEMFEHETQEIDLHQAREKHGKLDDTLRQKIRTWLEMESEAKLSSEEVEVLEMMLGHRFPRRQLFWAYQARSRYGNLAAFFEENTALMLAISSSGALVKRPR